MKRIFLVGLALLSGPVAFAGARYEEAAVDPNAICPTAPPVPGMIQVQGWKKALNKQEAVDGAHEDAVQKMLAQHGAGFGASTIEAMRRNTVDVAPPTFKDGWGCATVALRREFVDHLQSAGADLERQIQAIAATLKLEAKDRLVDVRPPEQGDSGAVSQLGDSIRSLLLQKMVGVRVLTDRWEAGAAQLQVQLTPNKVDMTGTVLLDGVVQGGFKFPLDLYNITPGEAGGTLVEPSRAPGATNRSGQGGLEVHIAPPKPSGIACEGDVVDLVADVAAPARVRLYNVLADGSAYLIWPPPNGTPGVPGGGGATADEVSRQLRLPGSTMLPSSDGRDERLVMVAVPPGASFGPTESWRGFCAVPGGFSDKLMPAGAAVSTTSFLVRRAETTGCAMTEQIATARVAAKQEVVSTAGACR